MQHQDWTPVVLRKTNKDLTNKEKKQKGIVIPVSKQTENKQSHIDVNMNKLENDENYKVPIISHNLSQQIQQARNNKKLTQKELAQKCRIQVSVVQNYENSNSKTKIESHILQKMSKILDVTLKKK